MKERIMFDITLAVAFFGIFLGVFLRTLLPSIDKLRAGQKWDNTYTATAAFALLTSLVTAVMAFPTFNLPPDTAGIFTTFIISFPFGWGLNDFYNKIFADLHDTTVATPAQSSTPTPGMPQPSTGSDIPPIPSVPATVFITGSQTIKAVTMDGQAYPLSNVSGTVKAGQWTSVKANNQTIVSIAFSDYVTHDVEIDYDTTALKLKLASGSIWPSA